MFYWVKIAFARRAVIRKENQFHREFIWGQRMEEGIHGTSS